MKRSSSSGKLQEPKKKKKDNRICIIHFERHKKGHIVNELTDSSFTRIKEVKQLRQNQVSKALRYEICHTIPDQYDTTKHFYKSGVIKCLLTCHVLPNSEMPLKKTAR